MCGKFSETYKLNKRLRQADFSREETKAHWINWAKETLAKSSPFRDLDLGDDSDVEVKLVEDETNEVVNPSKKL
jgi:hypothetical protein